MSDTYRRRPEATGSQHYEGARARERFKTGDDLENEAAEAEYAKQQGATGLGGAVRRSKPEYKSGLEAFKAERKKKRSATAADAASALSKK